MHPTYLEDGLVDAVRVHARCGRDDQCACGSNRVSSHGGQTVWVDNTRVRPPSTPLVLYSSARDDEPASRRFGSTWKTDIGAGMSATVANQGIPAGVPLQPKSPRLQLKRKRPILRPALVHAAHSVHPPNVALGIRHSPIPCDQDDGRQSRTIRLVARRGTHRFVALRRRGSPIGL